MEANEFEHKTKGALSRIGLGHWRVCWFPDSSRSIRGRIVPENVLIEIFDSNMDDAWNTFIHEIIEIWMRSHLRTYRVLVNKLIEGYQELADGEKDRFIENIMSQVDKILSDN